MQVYFYASKMASFFRKTIEYDPSARERYIEMSIEEKRKHYKCKSNYTTLNEIETWPVYCKKRKLLESMNFRMHI